MKPNEQQAITTPHCRACRHFDGKAECRRVIDKRGKGLKVGHPDHGACLYFKPKGALQA